MTPLTPTSEKLLKEKVSNNESTRTLKIKKRGDDYGGDDQAGYQRRN